MDLRLAGIILLALAPAIAGAYLYFRGIVLARELKNREIEIANREEGMNRQLYELAILSELGERIGYSLDVEKIVDIITGSLSQFIDYSLVASMLLEPEHISFKVHLDKSVSHGFIREVRKRMLKSLSALLDKEYTEDLVKETITGAIVLDEQKDEVSSFFNIPLVIQNQVVGVLTVAHTKAGLYREDEMTILYKITNQASRAVTRLKEVVSAEQAKLSAMVQSMADGVVMTDTDYRVLVANPAARQAANIPENKQIVTIFDFINYLSGAFDIRGRLEESIKLDKVIEIDDIVVRDRFYQIVVSPVKSMIGLQKGEIVGGVVLFHDTSAEKRAERLRDEFTSMIVHELRAPLDGIKKIMERSLDEKVKMDEHRRKEYMGMVHEDASRMLGLINDLLDAAKVEAGRFEVFKEGRNIATTIDETSEFYRESAADGELSLEATVAENLPTELQFDPQRIKQVLGNLLSNAIKFTGPGGSVHVYAFVHEAGGDAVTESKMAGFDAFVSGTEVDLRLVPDSVVVAVKDTGPGMTESQIGKLFNKFTQFTEAATQGKKGSGLGLVIAKGIVEAHGGVIRVVSRKEAGTTFFFTIPLAGSVAGVKSAVVS